jgi:hypothetical protein
MHPVRASRPTYSWLYGGPSPAFTVSSNVADREAESRQRVERGTHLQHYISPAATVAAIGAAARHVFLAAEMYHAIPTPAGFDSDFSLVNEHASIINVCGKDYFFII